MYNVYSILIVTSIKPGFYFFYQVWWTRWNSNFSGFILFYIYEIRSCVGVCSAETVKQLDTMNSVDDGTICAAVTVASTNSTVSTGSPPKKRRGLFSSYDRHLNTEPVKPSAGAVVALYVDNLPALAAQARKAALSWEAFRNDARFVQLQKLMEKILCIPATSAPVERVFSHGGLFMRPHRARLGHKVLSHLVFTKCNRHLH